MRNVLLASAIAIGCAAAPALADGAAKSAVEIWQEDPLKVFDASEVTLSDFLWLARPVVIFANTANDPRLATQLELLLETPEEVTERDIVLITDRDPRAMSDLRKELRPRDFQIVVIAKDGSIILRKPRPWDMRELSRSIDKMPMRRQELEAK